MVSAGSRKYCPKPDRSSNWRSHTSAPLRTACGPSTITPASYSANSGKMNAKLGNGRLDCLRYARTQPPDLLVREFSLEAES